jgi:hypothetical protein
MRALVALLLLCVCVCVFFTPRVHGARPERNGVTQLTKFDFDDVIAEGTEHELWLVLLYVHDGHACGYMCCSLELIDGVLACVCVCVCVCMCVGGWMVGVVSLFVCSVATLRAALNV